MKNKNGEEVSLLIIDSEGIGSLDADADHDAKVPLGFAVSYERGTPVPLLSDLEHNAKVRAGGTHSLTPSTFEPQVHAGRGYSPPPVCAARNQRPALTAAARFATH